MKKNLLIFDCDGVLVDSEILASHMTARALTAKGYPLSTEECILKFTGLSDTTSHQLIYKESGIHLPLDFFPSLQDQLLQHFETHLSPLIRDIFNKECVQKTSRCVASSSPRGRVLRTLEITEQIQFFDEKHVFTASQVAKGKPAPDLFLLAARTMGYSPEECIVIEDSTAGIEAALTASMKVIAFLGGGHAQFAGYKKKILLSNIPVAHNAVELFLLLESMLSPSLTE